ncbi:6-phosphogluconolactonase [Lycorma delicatula]|uniref:6-phosphogluconolactonase n=1 Tax=Lycorma delicatula TaxID=130591 RepID=UPI003F50E203
MTSEFEVIVVENEAEVIKKLSNLIEKKANDSIAVNGIFKIGLSGGSLVTFLSKGLPEVNTDWEKWRLFFCDERVVPVESADSTFGEYKKSLIGKVPLKESQFVTINTDLSAEKAAKDYITKMAVYFPPDSLPRFDTLLLGMGPDGHTCSLFPGHRLLDEHSVWVAPITDSPKPPPSRITLTFPVINNAECCIFAAAGKGKAPMIKKILKDKEPLPAGRVKPTNGKAYWILDKGAAELL